MVKDLKTIHYEITGNTGWLFINAPPANETTVEFFEELALIVDELTLMEILADLLSGARAGIFPQAQTWINFYVLSQPEMIPFCQGTRQHWSVSLISLSP